MYHPTKQLSVILLVATIWGRAASAPAALFSFRATDLSGQAEADVRSRPKGPNSQRAASKVIPHAVTFREVPGRGLLVRTWVNGIGPFNFAIDTGAGATLLSPRVAGEAHVSGNGRVASVGGLSGATRAAYHASLRSLAIGDIENNLPASGAILITSGLPADLDGVFDPTEALSPLGYTIDIPHHEFSVFDPNVEGLRRDQTPAGEGAVVAWLREGQGRRPFVMLDNGDRALLDTGSSLGFAVRDANAAGTRAHSARDIGGGQISARRGTTATIAIGSLVLRRIPTDFVSGTEADAPTLLGLAALRPFRLSFDPVHRLIEISAH